MTDDITRIAVMYFCLAVVFALMLFIVIVRSLDRLEKWNNEQILRYDREVYRRNHDPERNPRPTRHSPSPPDAILQGGKSDIDGTKLRD